MLAISLDRVLFRATLAAVIVALLLIPFPLVRAFTLLLVVGLLPGLSVAPRSSMEAHLGVGAALSPVIFGVTVLLALLAGIQVNAAAWVGVGVSAALFVWRGGFFPGCAPGDPQALRRVGVVMGIAAVLALALPLADTWWRWREDSWFHAAVANKLTRDSLPLADPYFAGLRLQYMYVYHAIVAACASLARIDFFYAMILVNAMALSSCALAFHALAGLFSRRVGPRVLGLCVWLFALNGWFYLFYPVRLARGLAGDTGGLEVMRQFFPWTPHGHATAFSLISIEGNQFMFLDKFMIGTAFSLTFGLAASLLYMLASARRGEWSPRHDLSFGLCILGALLLHVVTGATMAVVTALVLAFLLMIRAQPSPGGPSYARLVAWIGLAAAIATPYILSVSPRDGTGGVSMRLAFQPGYAIGLLSDILPALVLTVLFFRRADSYRDTPEQLGARAFAELNLSATGMIAMWTLLVLVVALFVDLTTNNETKFAFLVHLPLSAFAVGALERGWSSPRARRWLTLGVLSATIPLHLLYYHHAVRDESFETVSDQEKATYSWIQSKTPRDAVFIEENDGVRVPVLASRDIYWGTEGYARNWGYPEDEMVRRKRLRDAIFSEAGPSPEDVERLKALGRPVFVIYRLKSDELIDVGERFHAHPDIFRGRFSTQEIAVWEVQF